MRRLRSVTARTLPTPQRRSSPLRAHVRGLFDQLPLAPAMPLERTHARDRINAAGGNVSTDD